MIESKRFILTDASGQAFLSPRKGTLGGYRRKKIYGRLDCRSALRHLANGYYKQHRVFRSRGESR
jgi:hypothetical protein